MAKLLLIEHPLGVTNVVHLQLHDSRKSLSLVLNLHLMSLTL
jgi:hypothetical protein